MARRTATRVAAAAFILACVAGVANAQTLARLTVRSFDLSSDTTSPRVDVPFHLIVTLRVRERISRIDDLNLPMLAQLELLGDEREMTTGVSGTQYRESITVVAHDAGTIALAPATLQAIDARDGKAKEWFTNSLTLYVTGAPSRALNAGWHALLAAMLAVLRFVAWLLAWVLGIGCAAMILLLLIRRRRRAVQSLNLTPAVPPAPPPAPALRRSRRQQAHDALTVLRAERSRPAAIAVRGAIWRMVGASEGETLADVLRRADARDATTRALLIALERSAFTYDADFSAAVDDACSALERFIESVP